MKRYILSLLCCLLTVSAWADVTIKGVVYEPGGETAIGASVVEKGKPTNGTNTNIDGEFTLKVSKPDATIVVSYVGMETQEVKLNGRTQIEVTLKDNRVALAEVVVVGYGTQKKINATGAVKTIGNDVLEARPVTNAVQGLQGAVAGLNITNDAGGELGSSMNINIRGVGSIGEGSNSSPLVLIDGMEGDLSTINPNDIENISVLKDAAAASIYGSRAPFGVILVTTKSGSQGGRTVVSYTGSMRFQNPMKVPHMADSYTMALMINDAAVNSGENARMSNGMLGLIQAYQRGDIAYATEGYQNDMTKWKTHRESWGNTNWYDVYLKDHTTSTEHNLSITGGTDKIAYFLSGNYLDQTGLFNFADEKYQRLSLNSKVNVAFNKYVSLNWSTRLIVTDNEKPSALNTLFYHNIARREATIPVYTPTGEYHPDSMIESLVNGGRQRTRTQQLYNQANLTIEPVKDWKLHAEVNSRIENNPFTRQFNPIYYTRPDGERQGYQVLATGMAATYGFYGGGDFKVYPDIDKIYYEKRQGNVNYFSTNFYTDYNWNLTEKNRFKFLLGMQTEYFYQDITRTANTNILSQDKPYLPQTSINDTGVMISESKGDWSSMGIFGRVNYNYDDRYMLEVNMRGDGASRFPKNQRWGYFPSVSAGWNVANEKFFEPIVNTWNYFKLRASYGVLGNQNTTSFYPYYQAMATTPGIAVIGGSQAMTLPMYQPFSASLTWEKIENIGTGVDFAFMNNRLSGSFDWYQRTTKDMVGPARALSQVYGAEAPKTNNAELRTRGWELELAWRDRIGADFSYGISASLSDFKTIVSKYDSPDNKIDNWYQGKEYGEIWGYNTVGIAKSDDEMRAYLAQHAQGPSMGAGVTSIWGGGDLMYADLDNNGVVEEGSRTLDNHGDLVKIGNTTPRYAYSFTLEGQWKFIDVRAYFQGIGKRDYFIAGNTFFGFGKNEWQNSLFVEHLDYFRLAGSPLGANYENPYYARLRWDANNQLAAERFVQNAAYLRFKNLQIGFSLPQNTKLSKYVKKARIYGAAENLFCFTKLRIFDPEALSAENGDYNDGVGRAYPQYRTFSVGLELTF